MPVKCFACTQPLLYTVFMGRLWVHPQFQSAFTKAKLRTTRQLLAHLNLKWPRLPQGDTFVKEIELQITNLNLPAYFKIYTYSRPSWRFFGRWSKARREIESYEVFKRLGIRCARWIACGEVRDFIGRLRKAIILTESIPDALPLEEYLETYCPDGSRREFRQLRNAISAQIADGVRRIHNAGFFHHDLRWRNVLVTHNNGRPKVWWIDCPRGRFEPISLLRRRRAIKDIACLGRVRDSLFTVTEQARFIRDVVGDDHAEFRRLMREVTAYTARKWTKPSTSAIAHKKLRSAQQREPVETH